MENKSKKVLIVEDESIIVWNLCRVVEKAGYTVCATARSYEEAVEAFLKWQPDVVLLDIVLVGEKDGLEVATTLLQRQYVPIICLTAYSTGPYLVRISELDIFGYIIKPIDERELTVMIHLAMNQSDRAKVLAIQNKQQQHTIKQMEGYFRVLADSLPFVLIDCDGEGRIFYANEAAQKKLGITKGDSLVKKISLQENNTQKQLFTLAFEGKPSFYKVVSYPIKGKEMEWFLSFWLPIELPLSIESRGVRILAIPLREWLDHMLLPREKLWEHYQLSSREIDILRGILQGKRIHTIAEENFISLPTVKYHIAQLYTKMGVRDREELYRVLQEKIFADMPPDVFFAYLFTSFVPPLKK